MAFSSGGNQLDRAVDAPTAQSPAGYLQPAGLHMVGVSAIQPQGGGVYQPSDMQLRISS